MKNRRKEEGEFGKILLAPGFINAQPCDISCLVSIRNLQSEIYLMYASVTYLLIIRWLLK